MALYWHFVDVVWVFIVALLYVIPNFQGASWLLTRRSCRDDPPATALVWLHRLASPGEVSGLQTSSSPGAPARSTTTVRCAHARIRGARTIYILLSLLSLAIAIAAGVTSYRTWRRLSGGGRILRAEGYERSEFMALMGFFISFTLGVGIVWLSLPPLILELCGRAR